MTDAQTTLAEQAFNKIYGLIMSGQLPLGGVVNEVALSETLGFGRGPIREAIRRLQGLKLVTREPYMRARVVSLASSDVIEIFQLREAAEGMACRLAAVKMDEEALDTLVREFEISQSNARQPKQRSSPFDLHVAIASQCGNRRIEYLLCEELYHLLRLYRMRSGSEPGRHGQASEEHWQILRALKTRDPDLAESLMRSHIRRATNVLLTGMERAAVAG